MSKEYYTSIENSLLNGWNYILDEIQDHTVYFYIQAQLGIIKDLNHPLYGYSFEKIIDICNRCCFSDSKGYSIINTLDFFGFVRKEKTSKLFSKKLIEIQKWNKNSIYKIEEPSLKEVLFFETIPQIDCTKTTIFKQFYNQKLFTNILQELLKNRPNFEIKKYNSYIEFKRTLEKYTEKNKLNLESILKTTLNRYWKKALTGEYEQKRVILSSKAKTSIKIYNIDYDISDFSRSFSEEYVSIMKDIENKFLIPITKLFNLFGRSLGIKQDLLELKRIFDSFPHSQRVVVMGFNSFISYCLKNQQFLKSRKSFFLKSLYKFIENENNNIKKYNIVVKLKPTNKHEIDSELFSIFTDAYGEEYSKYFKYAYDCPNCQYEITLENLEFCPYCRTQLNWSFIENLDFIKKLVEDYQKINNEKILRKMQ